MTAQASERIIIEGRPRQLYAEPLHRLARQCRLRLGNPDCRSTGNYRGYVGTWEIAHGRLYLVHLCWDGLVWDHQGNIKFEVPMSQELRAKVLRAAKAGAFPAFAHWFNGVLRIPVGRRLVYSHQGWSSWYERERVIHVRAGEVGRDREVDTQAMLERRLRRDHALADWLDPSITREDGLPKPLFWFDNDDEDWTKDWWPPDYTRRPSDDPERHIPAG